MTAARACLALMLVCGPAAVMAQDLQNAPIPSELTEEATSQPPSQDAFDDATGFDPDAGAPSPEVTTRPLTDPDRGAAGLLPVQDVGLPATLWSGSQADRLASLIATTHPSLPALQEMMRLLVLAEAAPPDNGPGADGKLLGARLDWLVSHGAVDEALALVELAGPDTPSLFARWTDLVLLLGQADAPCQELEQRPGLSDALDLRVFCLARAGDWPRAALVLNTARALGALPERRIDLIERFLDPSLHESRPPLVPPVRPTPLEFRLFEAIGEPLPTAQLPLAYSVLDLAGRNGWRSQLEAAERLARAGSLPAGRLRGLYVARAPAASGGVWDRVAGFQDLETALRLNDREAITNALINLWPQMASARLLVPFADLFGAPLLGAGLEGRSAQIAQRAALLSRDYQVLAGFAGAGSEAAALRAVAQGAAPDPQAALPQAEAIARGFSSATPSQQLLALRDDNRMGEALLQTISRFQSGVAGNGDDLATAIATLRALGFDGVARRASLQLMILGAERAL